MMEKLQFPVVHKMGAGHLAHKNGYYELAMFIEDHKREYVRFIMTGEE